MSDVQSIFDLPRKKKTAFWDLLVRGGMTPERVLAALDAPLGAVREWIALSPTAVDPAMIFTAKRVGILLGLKTPDRPAPVPARPDERIVYLPESIASPTDLRGTKAPMHRKDWYDNRGYTAKPGYWGVILPVRESNRRSHVVQDKQIAETLHGYQRTPMLVDALALSLELLATGKDLLDGDWVRCPEQTSAGRHVGLDVYDGRVYVGRGWDGVPDGHVWSSAARWICS